jgi:DNA-binding CsgD family transcriptional regulator
LAAAAPFHTDPGDPEWSLSDSMQDCIESLSAFEVRALVILGPISADDLTRREVWAAHPARYQAAAAVLAGSDVYGAPWRASSSPPMAWQNVCEYNEAPWRASLLESRVHALVRCDMAMPFGAGYECFAFVGRHLAGKAEASEIGWALVNIWPLLRHELVTTRFGLSDRTREVLRVLAEGKTAKETADIVGLKERTVHFHLATVMERLNAGNRAAAILRACMLGLL